MTKHAPATPLPWHNATLRTEQEHESGAVGTPYGRFRVNHNKDAAYIAHAANAYPRLVEALRDALALLDEIHAPSRAFWSGAPARDRGRTLLRELGEES